MNILHGNIHTWGLHNTPVHENATCLDIGCGGGNTVKVLAEKARHGNVYGLDHSENSKWSDFLQLKNAKAYEDMLRAAGFQDISLDNTTKKGWIKVIARVSEEER